MREFYHARGDHFRPRGRLRAPSYLPDFPGNSRAHDVRKPASHPIVKGSPVRPDAMQKIKPKEAPSRDPAEYLYPESCPPDRSHPPRKEWCDPTGAGRARYRPSGPRHSWPRIGRARGREMAGATAAFLLSNSKKPFWLITML